MNRVDMRGIFDLKKLTERAETIGIAGHVRPDGDSVGAVLGLYNYLKKVSPEKKLMAVLGDPPSVFSTLQGFDEIVSPEAAAASGIVFDLFFALDLGDIKRLGAAGKCFEEAADTACVDHHVSNQGFANHDYVEPEASSASELVYTLLDPDQIDAGIAECLYTGIIHDTGVLQYSCTSRRTLEITGKLIEFGFNFQEIIDSTFHARSYLQNQLLGRALMESVLSPGGKFISSVLDRQIIDFYGARPADFEGIVNQLLRTKGVECACFMTESGEEPGLFKVSLRSRDLVDVSLISQKFGGGGHKKAAGFSLWGKPGEILKRILKEVEAQLSPLV